MKLRQQEFFDKHVLEQAASFLSPAQFKILGSIQARMMALRKSGYAMFGDQNRTRFAGIVQEAQEARSSESR